MHLYDFQNVMFTDMEMTWSRVFEIQSFTCNIRIPAMSLFRTDYHTRLYGTLYRTQSAFKHSNSIDVMLFIAIHARLLPKYSNFVKDATLIMHDQAHYLPI